MRTHVKSHKRRMKHKVTQVSEHSRAIPNHILHKKVSDLDWKEIKLIKERLHPMQDADKDGKKNYEDCKPLDKKRQHSWVRGQSAKVSDSQRRDDEVRDLTATLKQMEQKGLRTKDDVLAYENLSAQRARLSGIEPERKSFFTTMKDKKGDLELKRVTVVTREQGYGSRVGEDKHRERIKLSGDRKIIHPARYVDIPKKKEESQMLREARKAAGTIKNDFSDLQKTDVKPFYAKTDSSYKVPQELAHTKKPKETTVGYKYPKKTKKNPFGYIE